MVKNMEICHSFKKNCNLKDRSDNPVVKAVGLRSVTLGRENLQTAEKFFIDFGLEVVDRRHDVVLLRGRGDKTVSVIIEKGKNQYKGFTVEVASMEDLKRLSEKTRRDIETPSYNRGELCIHLTDPIGTNVEVIFNPRSCRVLPTALPVPFNCPGQYERVNKTIRIEEEFPPWINRLGHTVLGASHAEESIAWYQDTFGMIVSDFQFLDNDPVPVTAFMRFDLGNLPADHHSIAIVSVIDVGHMHTSFEVRDFDTVMSCFNHLKPKGYHHTWGIGRHIFGSQIFDYWRDPEGEMFEHYADGDLFDSTLSAGYNRFSSRMIYQWGPKMNADMAGKIPTFSRVKTIMQRLLSPRDELTLRRLLKLVKASF